MPSLLSRALRRPPEARSITTVDDYVEALNLLTYQGNTYGISGLGINQTMTGEPTEPVASDLSSHAATGYSGNAVVFACMVTRMRVLSGIRFTYQRFNQGKPSEFFGLRDLALLETPWPGGTTQDLISRAVQDADLAGNSYWARSEDSLIRLRPDWVEIVLEARMMRGGMVGWDKLGYLYTEGGRLSGNEPVPFLPDEVAHFAPNPDPMHTYRGMSWLTPVIREISSDRLMSRHKEKFFSNAAAQPYTVDMLTPHGWVRMGDITVGDSVTGPDGKPRRVLGVYPQGEKDIYKLTFTSGATTECCEDHLWQVSNAYDRKLGTYRLLTLRQIVESGIKYPSGAAKWAVPLSDPVEYDGPQSLPMDPYLLGMLLGDGSFRSNGKGSGGVTLAAGVDDADETEALLRPLLPDGVTISRRDRGGWVEMYFKGLGGPRENPLTRIIRDLDLFDVPGYRKSVPTTYMRGSVNDRVALLQGLLDSDGHVNRARTSSTGVRFTSTSHELVRQVRELAQSLGGIATVKTVDSPGRRSQWLVRINRLPEWIIPVRLSRKRADYRGMTKVGSHRNQYLQSVELIGRKPAQCIKVDSADGLYVTDDFIVTHNTPNLVVKLPQMSIEDFKRFKAAADAEHRGLENAYKTMYIGGGADVTVVGSNIQQMQFPELSSVSEARIAAAAGVPPVVANLMAGLERSTYSNYSTARRLFADGTCHPTWLDLAGTFATILPPPPGTRLHYDSSDVPMLREDAKDASEIAQTNATIMRSLVDAGYTPESVQRAALAAWDFGLLEHSGLFSVQLQAANANAQAVSNGSTGSSGTNGSSPDALLNSK